MTRLLAAIIAILLVVAWPAVARSHGLDPVGVSVREHSDRGVTVTVDRPSRGAPIEVSLGAGCTASPPTSTPSRPGRLLETYRYRCDGPVAGRTVAVQGLDAAGLDAVLRVEGAEGAVHRAVLTARTPRLLVREPPSRPRVAASYALLGAEHLARGPDHLAFILGAALLARRARRIALVLTAFTVGHSVTLSAVALGLFRLPSAWAEIAIAATLVWLAIEVIHGASGERRVGRIVLACGVVGLVHGIGFASALSEIGLPEHDVPLALLGFNVGLELAQLAIVAAACSITQLSSRIRTLDWGRARPVAGHAIGALAAMWCLERLAAL